MSAAGGAAAGSLPERRSRRHPSPLSDPGDRGERHAQPVGPVGVLVAHLVDRLVQFEGAQQLALVARVRRDRGVPLAERRPVAVATTPGRARPAPARPAGRPAAAGPRSRTTAACPPRRATATAARGAPPPGPPARPRSRSAASRRRSAAPGPGAGRRGWTACVTESAGSVRSCLERRPQRRARARASSGTSAGDARPAGRPSPSSCGPARRRRPARCPAPRPGRACTSATARPSRSASPAKSPPTSSACSSGARPSGRARWWWPSPSRRRRPRTNCWSMPTVVGSPPRSPVIEPSGCAMCLLPTSCSARCSTRSLFLPGRELAEQLEDVLPAVDQRGVALLRRDRPGPQAGSPARRRARARRRSEPTRALRAIRSSSTPVRSRSPGRLVGVEVPAGADPAAPTQISGGCVRRPTSSW